MVGRNYYGGVGGGYQGPVPAGADAEGEAASGAGAGWVVGELRMVSTNSRILNANFRQNTQNIMGKIGEQMRNL